MIDNPKYKITGLWYSKPRIIHKADGEVSHGRVGEFFDIGQLANFNGVGMKKVVDIQFMEAENQFYIYFDKGGIKVVQYQYDTEIIYEPIDEKRDNKPK